ncbi:hypothetical protein [Mycobacterium sp. URHB0044]|uniref:hypothetical protein n=1 Tax=Mycobacterium sp. URHB0044 TaxID=1380386 RepID=UPI0012DE2AE0|nr:hypothetical protein [Mycobacterium sp. URHB0044]
MPFPALLRCAAGIGLTAVTLAAAPLAVAAPTGAVNAITTIQELQANGYRVILNKVGTEPLSSCHVTSIRPGPAVTETVPAGGGDTMQRIVYTPVYVDVAP